MPRPIRIFSESKLYHIVLKSINSQRIFENDSDFKFFLETFSDLCQEYSVKIYAYCLMSNHIHLLLQFNDDNLPVLFKSFGAKYVPKYNYAHGRTGSLFKGRYYSKPINDDSYLLSVVRYIHYNPVKAGLCKTLQDYKWSSYSGYKKNNDKYADTSFLMDIIDLKQFDELHEKDDIIEEFIIRNSINPMTYEELVSQAEKMIDTYSVNDVYNAMKRAGLSKTTISKVLNIDKRKL